MSKRTQLPATTDVLIVGAGPVGLTLAASVAAEGVPAVVVDRCTAGGQVHRPKLAIDADREAG